MGYERCGRRRLTVPVAAMALGAMGSWPLRKFGVGDAAYVPDLREDVASGVVNCGGDGLPGFGLFA